MTSESAANAADAHTFSARHLASLLRHQLAVDRNEPALLPPTLAIVGFSRASTDVLRRCLDQPERAIIGFTLPTRYQAIGVVASSVVATAPSRAHHDASLALAASRDGQVVSLLASDSTVQETRSPHGWLLDACQRSIGLPTEPCNAASLALPIALWLDRLMVAILNTHMSSPITWPDAVDLCPIPSQWRTDDPVDLGITLGSTTRSWRSLRAACATGETSLCGVAPQAAAWMDDAMFARWCIGSFPDLNSLRGDVEFLASDQVAGNIALALQAAWSAFTP